MESAGQPINQWYLVGDCIGSSPWSNDGVYDIGSGLIPTYPAYDTDGTLMPGCSMYVGYFPEGGQFKFVHIPGDWSEQLNYTNVVSPGWFLSDEDGDNHNIGINEAGYYTILINAYNEITIEKYEQEPTLYEMISMPGDYQDWDPGATLMTPMNTVVENHDWVKDLTFEENSELKFAANGEWYYNWGSEAFPVGVGIQYGPNIPVSAGTYTVVFNDILGTYYFIEETE
jgi:hypothetical protein